MSETLDPVTRHHVDRAAEELARRVRRDLLGRRRSPATSRSRPTCSASARINVFVPVLAHRFARERLQGARPGGGSDRRRTQPEVLFVCVHNAGRSQMAAGLVKLRSDGRVHVRSAGSDAGGRDQPGRGRGDERDRRRHERGVPEAAHRRGRPRRRRRDHDGLRRRLPDLSRASATRTGSSTTRPGRTSRRCARIRDEIDAARAAR